ncbi:Hypothetical protein EUBREC_1590 [Agathobacter rectalis ATCC 33656]|uniref:Uncharacterized protein n=1 Tax=Agathobacter rectalis (strain ATCC 33656 / DSM 3377 / JCM 17463 / KCTC 5835 / VPI 0990) TaxID=515619 RepID=C4Z9B2_AGARV|nr:Hypothetical protein EUBREC_1590 [Agathobacter rectalis ATCC 33656]
MVKSIYIVTDFTKEEKDSIFFNSFNSLLKIAKFNSAFSFIRDDSEFAGLLY